MDARKSLPLRACCVLTLLVLLVTCFSQQDLSAADNDDAKLEGRWSLKSGVDNGSKLSAADAEQMKLEVRGNQLGIQDPGGGSQGTFKLDPAQKPAAIDLEIKGQTIKGIYALEGTTLRLCFAAPNQPRPTEFRSPRGTRIVLLVWERGERASRPTAAEKRPRRPQEPVRPYPYHDEEVSYENKKAGVRFAGTLTYPKTGGPFPAVLLITGSGERNRDETLKTHKMFLVLADYFTRKGIAVLRVDDRGVGGSTGSNAYCTSEDFAADVLCGVAYLRKRKEIKPNWVGVCGHSEGGLIGPLAASRSRDIAFVIMMAGPGVPGDELLYYQDALLSRDADEETLAKYRRLQKRSFAVIKTEKDNAAAEKKIRAIVAEEMAGVSEEQRQKLATPEDVLYKRNFTGYLGPWFRFFLSHDPRTTLAKVDCPVLAILGETDRFVPPVPHAKAIEKGLEAGGNKDYMVKVIPGVNHLLQTNPGENYARVEETVSPIALEMMATWILQRTVERK